MVLCNVQLVCIAFDYVCRSNYELRYARIFTGRNGNSVWEVDVMSSHGNFGNANLYTGIRMKNPFRTPLCYSELSAWTTNNRPAICIHTTKRRTDGQVNWVLGFS